MKIEKKVFEHHGVKPDGTFENEAGSVHADGNINTSAPWGGCGMEGCNCSPGHYIAVSLPRTPDGVVRGIAFHFKSRDDMLEYLDIREVTDWKGFFNITSVSRDDVKAVFRDNQKFVEMADELSDSDMQYIAKHMANAYIENGYWIDLEIIAGDLIEERLADLEDDDEDVQCD